MKKVLLLLAVVAITMASCTKKTELYDQISMNTYKVVEGDMECAVVPNLEQYCSTIRACSDGNYTWYSANGNYYFCNSSDCDYAAEYVLSENCNFAKSTKQQSDYKEKLLNFCDCK